jgi:hypothetical protein
MANRNYTQFSYGFEKFPVTLYAVAEGNAGADMVLKAPNADGSLKTAGASGYKGVKSITYDAATGRFVINLTDSYNRLLALHMIAESIDHTTAATVSSVMVYDKTLTGASPLIKVGVYNLAGALANPTTNVRLYFTITLSNSNSN